MTSKRLFQFNPPIYVNGSPCTEDKISKRSEIERKPMHLFRLTRSLSISSCKCRLEYKFIAASKHNLCVGHFGRPMSLPHKRKNITMTITPSRTREWCLLIKRLTDINRIPVIIFYGEQNFNNFF